jgi:hypothetical protein
MGRSKAEIKTGDRFGRLTIIEETEPYINGSNKIRRFICKCDCANHDIHRWFGHLKDMEGIGYDKRSRR